MNRKIVLIFIIIPSFIIIQGVTLVQGSIQLKPNMGGICLDCHPELKQALTEGKPHKPSESKECTSCHSPHATSYKYQLLQTGDTLCYGCHESEKTRLNEKTVHLPVEYGECLKCHKPHVSPFENLLRLEGKEMCYQCHDKSPFEKKYIHKPVNDGRCNDCHQAHSSANPFLLTLSSPQLCFKCHPLNSDLIAKHPGYKIDKVNCTLCHNAHSSNKENLLYSFWHEPFEKNRCKECHGDTSGDIKAGSGDSKTCYKCHKDAQEKFKKKKKNHIVEGPKECIFCHNPHAAEREDLVRRSDRPLCTSCHEDMGQRLRVIKKGLYRHPEITAGKCTTCHDAHSSNEPNFLIDNPLMLCTVCHARHKVSCHPVGDEALDPRSKTPIDCITCHNPMESQFPMIMRLDGSKELCNQCHRY